MAPKLVLPKAAGGTVGVARKLQIKNTSDLDQAHAHILVYGPTKSGKTTTAVSLGTPEMTRIVSTQPEEQLAHLKSKGIPYVRVRSGTELDEVLMDPRGTFTGEWDTLVIDDLTEAVDYYVEHFDNVSKDSRQVYKHAKRHLRDRLEYLLEGDYNLIGTALDRQLEDDFKMMWITPDLPPSIMGLVTAKFSFICYLHNHKLITKRDMSRRILAGNRLPKDKVDAFKAEEAPELDKLWKKFQDTLKDK